MRRGTLAFHDELASRRLATVAKVSEDPGITSYLKNVILSVAKDL